VLKPGLTKPRASTQSAQFEQLEKALSREKKGHAELQEQLQIGKKAIISQFNKFKKLDKQSPHTGAS